jgi:hypothetical protein
VPGCRRCCEAAAVSYGLTLVLTPYGSGVLVFFAEPTKAKVKGSGRGARSTQTPHLNVANRHILVVR